MKLFIKSLIILVFSLTLSAQTNLEKLGWLEGGWTSEKWELYTS